jgi:hypothetical protein
MMRGSSRKSDETFTRTSGLCLEAKGMVCKEFNTLTIE